MLETSWHYTLHAAGKQSLLKAKEVPLFDPEADRSSRVLELYRDAVMEVYHELTCLIDGDRQRNLKLCLPYLKLIIMNRNVRAEPMFYSNRLYSAKIQREFLVVV